MAATKKGKTDTPAEATAARALAGSRKGATRNTKVSPGSDGTNPSESKAKVSSSKTTAPIKLTDRQRDFLKRIHEAGAIGYEPANKNEQRSIESLSEKKLLKKGKKNREKGVFSYMLTKSGEKQLTPAPAPPTS